MSGVTPRTRPQVQEGRQTLLAVDDEVLAVLVADDDRAEEVMPVLPDILAGSEGDRETASGCSGDQ
jgi:hypothetical protein